MDDLLSMLRQHRRQVLKRRLYAAVDYRATLTTGEWVPEADIKRMTKLGGPTTSAPWPSLCARAT